MSGSGAGDGRPPRAVGAARRPVLLINPRSGDGKADRVGLVAHCEALGIEPVVLQRGDDLAERVEAAVASGADAVGMAGGDGSQGVVAAVLARHGVAMVVVPSGTRNHLAMDLGLDRRNVPAALAAFGDARERLIDLAEVNGRVFLNNVSFGVYAEIVRSPDYRAAKAETVLSSLPSMVGPGSRPFELRYTGPSGELHTAAHVVQVSNNPYGGMPGSITSRPRLDGGVLGVLVVELPVALRPRGAAAASSVDRTPIVRAWEATSFTVDSSGPLDAGIDGEAVGLTPPAQFRIRPGALRVRVPGTAGLSPAARELAARTRVHTLVTQPRARAAARSSGS